MCGVLVLACVGNYRTDILMLGVTIINYQPRHHDQSSQAYSSPDSWSAVCLILISHLWKNCSRQRFSNQSSASVIRSVSSCIHGSRSCLCAELKLWSIYSVATQWDVSRIFISTANGQCGLGASNRPSVWLMPRSSSDNFLCTLLSSRALRV